jgi:hypothetical protein
MGLAALDTAPRQGPNEEVSMPRTIDSPTNGADLTSSQFHVTGTWDNQFLQSFIQNGSTTVIGTMTAAPPSYVFQYLSVPVGSGYTLTVMDIMNNSQTVTGLVVT